MQSEPFNHRSAGTLFCGIFSIILLSSMIALPGRSISPSIKQHLKDSRPYKLQVTEEAEKRHARVPVLSFIERELKFNELVLRAAEKHNVEAALIKAVIMAESGYNHRAVSKKGAVGLMQLMPATASSLGVEDPFNPEHNVNGGVKYLKKLLIQFNGDVELALAAYNAGSRKVREYNGIPPFKATQIYIQNVFRYYRHYKGLASV